jgi:hypothetical protein
MKNAKSSWMPLASGSRQKTTNEWQKLKLLKQGILEFTLLLLFFAAAVVVVVVVVVLEARRVIVVVFLTC